MATRCTKLYSLPKKPTIQNIAVHMLQIGEAQPYGQEEQGGVFRLLMRRMCGEKHENVLEESLRRHDDKLTMPNA